MSEPSYPLTSVLDTLKSSVEILLQERYEGDQERGGFVLDDYTLHELTNLSETPTEGAILDIQDGDLHLLPRVIATWHTHPGATSNLSVGDAETFCQWPQQFHAIVGENGIRWYGVKNGAVINA